MAPTFKDNTANVRVSRVSLSPDTIPSGTKREHPGNSDEPARRVSRRVEETTNDEGKRNEIESC